MSPSGWIGSFTGVEIHGVLKKQAVSLAGQPVWWSSTSRNREDRERVLKAELFYCTANFRVVVRVVTM